MRSIHADLQTAQESLSATPYIYIYINSTDYSSRLLQLEHVEEPYRDRATVVLRNDDLALSNIDLVGQYFEIGYGYNTDSGDRYSTAPGLWVKSQQFVSMEGELVCVLQCEGIWMLLREIRYVVVGDPPYYEGEYTASNTVYEIIDLAIQEAGGTLDALGDQDDSIINTFQPTFGVNYPPFETAASIIYRLISMTKCYLRPQASKAFKVIYPQTTDTPNETYYSNASPYFEEYVEKKNLLVPNSVSVFANRDADGTWDNIITGTATDQASIDKYTTVTYYEIAPYITTQENADNRASAILTRAKAEILAARLLLPFHDCRVELYDIVSIEDYRGT